MQQLKETAHFFRDYYELYFWLAAVVPVALLLLRRSGLPQKGSIRQKCVAYPVVSLSCYMLAVLIKDFSLSAFFSRFSQGYYWHLLVKLVLLELVGYLVIKAILYLVVNPHKLDFLWRHKWFFLILACPILQIFLDFPRELNEWTSIWYVTDYSLGIGTRFFIGEVCHLLFGDYVSETQVLIVICGSLLLLFVCFAVMGEVVIKTADREIRPAVSFLVLCFLCSPSSLGAMGRGEVLGRTENHTLLVCIIAVFLFVKLKNTTAKYVMLGILGTLCNAIYQGYIFLYFPILLMLMVDDIFAEKEHPWRRTAFAAGACVPVGLSFLYFQFFAGTNFTNASEMAAALQQRTDMEIMEEPLYYELFVPITTAYRNITEPFLAGTARQKLLFTMLLVLPVLVLAAALYLKCFALVRAQGKNVWCTPYPWFLLMQLCALPQFILNIDWGRWMIALGVDLFFGILYLVYRQRTEMLQAMRSLAHGLKQKPLIALVALLWLASLNKFKAPSFLPEADSLQELFARIIS